MNLFSLDNDKYLRLIGIPVLGIMIPYITILVTPCSSNVFFMEQPHVYSVFMVACVFESNRWLLAFFRKKYNSLSETFKRISIQLGVQVIFTLALLFVLLYVWYKYILGALIYMPFLYNNLYVGISLPIIITLIYESTYFVEKWKEEFARNKQFEIESVKTQLHLLKKQIDPHFLFNSLSALSSLIETNKEDAIEFVDEFSDVYRYIITHKDETLASLHQEVKFTKNYIELLKKRFGKGLSYVVNIEEHYMQRKIPTLSLQMLTENAIKHNVFNDKTPLNIHVSINGEFLIVKNNLKKKQLTVSSTKTGLNNIVNRYKLLGDYEVIIDQNDEFFIVKIPVLKG